MELILINPLNLRNNLTDMINKTIRYQNKPISANSKMWSAFILRKVVRLIPGLSGYDRIIDISTVLASQH